MTKPGNGYLDHKDQGGTTGGSLCVHLERERVPVERFRLRDSDWKNACLPRSELSIREQRKLNSLHASISEASHGPPQVCFFSHRFTQLGGWGERSDGPPCPRQTPQSDAKCIPERKALNKVRNHVMGRLASDIYGGRLEAYINRYTECRHVRASFPWVTK